VFAPVWQPGVHLTFLGFFFLILIII
jgi:hypothetical protein